MPEDIKKTISFKKILNVFVFALPVTYMMI